VASGAAALLTERHRTAGLLLGLSIFAKVTNVLAVVPLVLFLFRGDRKAFVRLAIPMVLPIAALGLSNWVMYGAPWTTSYNRILVVKDGVPEIVSYSKAFGTSLEDGLARYFSTSLEGELFQAAPLPVLACLGLVPLAFTSWRLAAGIGGTCAGFTVLFALYDFGGARFFMPIVMLAVAPGAALLACLGRALDVPLRAWRAVRDSHRTVAWFPAIAAVALVGLVGLPWVLRQVRAFRSDSMAADVEHLAVRADKIPCDYFNMARQKWECSGLDREEMLFTGTAIDGQCAFAGRPMLRIPAAPGSRRRTVEWRPMKDGGTLDLAFGLDEGSKSGGPLTFTIRAGAMTPFRRTVTTAGILSQEALGGRFVAGEPVELEIDPGPRGAALCVDVRVR
jgi:hypothetical protein